MATIVYNAAFKSLLDGDIDMANDTIKVALVTSSYTPDQDNDIFFDDITNEVVGTGYSAGGEALADIVVTLDNDVDEAYLTASETVWLASTITARGAVVYKDTGTPATSPLIAYYDFGGDESTTNDTFRLIWSNDGFFNITALEL